MPPKSTTTQPLTGEALIDKVKQMAEASEKEKAVACGYGSVTKRGTERINLQSFRNALIEALGISLDGKGSKSGGPRPRGRSRTNRIKVQANGNLLISKGYTQEMGLKPGDEFEIHIGRKHIKLLLSEGLGEGDEI